MIDYRHPQGVKYAHMPRSVMPCLPVCSYLIGAQWDELALAAVSTLRPSSIRVTGPTDSQTCDGSMWRVSVYVDSNNTILGIEQEMIADVPDHIEHGHALRMKLRELPGWIK